MAVAVEREKTWRVDRAIFLKVPSRREDKDRHRAEVAPRGGHFLLILATETL